MHKPMSDHLILALETLAPFTTRTAFDWTIVRTVGAMYIGMRAES